MDTFAAQEQDLIIVRLLGGLGNQMFQYALGRHLSLKHRRPLLLDLSAFLSENHDPRFTARSFGLGIFNIEKNFAGEKDMTPFKKYIKQSFYSRLIRRVNGYGKYFSRSYIFEPRGKNFIFDARLLRCPLKPVVYLDGFWQSEKYFQDIEQVIRKDFTFASPPDAVNADLLQQVSSQQSVGIHIRHGDNATKIAAGHGVLPLQYYYEAINETTAKILKPHFYIFSDDPKWAKANLKLKYQVTYIDHNLAQKDYEDLRLMSACKHHIIGNSTFSWWAAWLGKKPGQLVFAPKRYHMKENISTKDFYPPSWQLVNVE